MPWPNIFCPRVHRRSPKKSDVMAATMPSATRAPGPTQLLSTAYLKKNAAPKISVTTPMMLIQLSPMRVSSAGEGGIGGGAASSIEGGTSRGGGGGIGGGVQTTGGGAVRMPIAASILWKRCSISS